MTNEFYNDAGKKLAQVTSNGVWLRLTNRKIVEPPENLLRALGLLPKSDYFKEL